MQRLFLIIFSPLIPLRIQTLTISVPISVVGDIKYKVLKHHIGAMLYIGCTYNFKLHMKDGHSGFKYVGT